MTTVKIKINKKMNNETKEYLNQETFDDMLSFLSKGKKIAVIATHEDPRAIAEIIFDFLVQEPMVLAFIMSKITATVIESTILNTKNHFASAPSTNIR